MQIYLMRHGQTEYNAKGRFTGQADIPLNDVGRAQIGSLAPRLSEVHFDHVFASPLMRAIETAQIVAPGQSVETLDWLKEMDVGTWTGLTWAEAKGKDPKGTKRYERNWLASAGDGETFQDVYDRVEKGLAELIPSLKPNDTILMVSHGAPVRLIAMILLKLPKEAYWHLIPAQGVYSHLTAYPNKEPWFSLMGWNVGPEPGWRK